MRRTTYAVQQSGRGEWTLTVSHPSLMSPFPTPSVVGKYNSQRAALAAALRLAGRSADVVVF